MEKQNETEVNQLKKIGKEEQNNTKIKEQNQTQKQDKSKAWQK